MIDFVDVDVSLALVTGFPECRVVPDVLGPIVVLWVWAQTYRWYKSGLVIANNSQQVCEQKYAEQHFCLNYLNINLMWPSSW